MAQDDKRFVKIHRQGGFTKDVEIWVDRVTGVNYLWITEGYAGGLTPLLSSDGKPVITPLSSFGNE